MKPRPLPVFGPPDQVTPAASMPVLGFTPGDVVAILAQHFELAGHPVALTDTTRPVAARGAELLPATFGLTPEPESSGR